MREILFRGKSKSRNKWVYGWHCGKILSPDFSCTEESSQIIDSETLFWHTCEPGTVGQFTELTDKNGKKIFEGDILRGWSDYRKEYFYEGIVKYGEFNCSCCNGVYGWYLDGGDIRNIDSYEVCGNIHDNPELVEAKNERRF